MFAGLLWTKENSVIQSHQQICLQGLQEWFFLKGEVLLICLPCSFCYNEPFLVIFLFPMIFILFANLTYTHDVKQMLPKPLTALACLGFCVALLLGCLVGLMVCDSTPCLGDSHLTAFRVATRMRSLSSCTNTHTKCMCMGFPFFCPLWGYPRAKRNTNSDKKWKLRYLPEYCWGSHRFAHPGPLKQCSC